MHKNLDNVEKESDEMNPMDMSDDKDSDERYQIIQYDELKVSDVIKDLKLGNLSLHKNLDNVEKESDKRKRINTSDDKDSTERDKTSKNYEETLTGVDGESDEIYQI